MEPAWAWLEPEPPCYWFLYGMWVGWSSVLLPEIAKEQVVSSLELESCWEVNQVVGTMLSELRKYSQKHGGKRPGIWAWRTSKGTLFSVSSLGVPTLTGKTDQCPQYIRRTWDSSKTRYDTLASFLLVTEVRKRLLGSKLKRHFLSLFSIFCS